MKPYFSQTKSKVALSDHNVKIGDIAKNTVSTKLYYAVTEFSFPNFVDQHATMKEHLYDIEALQKVEKLLSKQDKAQLKEIIAFMERRNIAYIRFTE